MKRILITAEHSYLGDALAEHLDQFPDQFQCDKISLRDGTWRVKALTGYDSVFHVAGIAHANAGKLSESDSERYYAVNSDLAVEFAQRAKESGIQHFIHMSSMIIYGKASGGRITPDTVPQPDSVYGDSKWKGEQGIAALADETFSVAIIRAPMIYGPRCKGNYRALARLATKSPIFPAVKNKRSMLYVGNLCILLQKLIETKAAGVFFPQNSEYVCTCDLVSLIAKARGKQTRLVKWVAPAIRGLMLLPGKAGNLARKAFGDQTYDLSMSQYAGIEYQKYDLETSVALTEGEGK